MIDSWVNYFYQLVSQLGYKHPLHPALVHLPIGLVAGAFKIFVAHCGICHPKGGNIIKPNQPIRNSSKLKDLDTFISWIRHPKAPMPPFPDTQISASQAQELFQYISQVLVL